MLFLDESGTPPSSTARNANRYFVIAGVVIPEESWRPLRDDNMGMKIRLQVRGELKWRYFAAGNSDDANPLRAMDAAQRDEVRRELFRIVIQTPGLTALACVACVEAAYELDSIEDRDDLYEATYKPVSERFQYYLQDLDRKTAKGHLGIVVCDHRGAQDDARLKRHHEKLLYAKSSVVSSYPNLIESLFVQSSNLSVGIQIADMIAERFGGIWRKGIRDGLTSSNPSFETATASSTGMGWSSFRSRLALGEVDAG